MLCFHRKTTNTFSLIVINTFQLLTFALIVEETILPETNYEISDYQF